MLYGPPLVVDRLRLYIVAPALAFQVRFTCAFPAVAFKPVGVAGGVAGAAGVAETSEELALSPLEFTAETT